MNISIQNKQKDESIIEGNNEPEQEPIQIVYKYQKTYYNGLAMLHQNFQLMIKMNFVNQKN